MRAVLVGARPDDMELRCAGTLALHTLRGEPLHKRAWQGDIRYNCANIYKSKRIRSEPQSLGERGLSALVSWYYRNRLGNDRRVPLSSAGVNSHVCLTSCIPRGLRVVRYDIVRGWMPKSKGFDIEAEMNHIVERRGYKTVEIPIDYRDRLGEKKLKLRHGFTILRRIMVESI